MSNDERSTKHECRTPNASAESKDYENESDAKTPRTPKALRAKLTMSALFREAFGVRACPRVAFSALAFVLREDLLPKQL